MANRMASLLVVAISVVGCHHATVDTGLEPSTRKIERRWASGWIYGLVPPSTVETAERCSNGVARVETKLSFLNQLVGILTVGIYTPMSIEVTCAEGGRGDEAVDVEVEATANQEKRRAALTEAAQLSAQEGRAVLVGL